jgi:hypothetical protein
MRIINVTPLEAIGRAHMFRTIWRGGAMLTAFGPTDPRTTVKTHTYKCPEIAKAAHARYSRRVRGAQAWNESDQ